jgi:RHS repeat-associated protein
MVMMETNESGEVLVQYTYEPNGYLPISQTRNGQTYMYHYDGSDNVRVLRDLNGEIVVEYGYDSKGKLLFAIGEAENDFLFSGQQFDTETRLYYHRARYRDPATSRFTQMDQYQGRMQEPATLHKYNYAHNDPVNQRDPSGHFSIGNLNTVLGVQATLTTTASASLQPFVTKAVLGTLIATSGLYLASDQATKLMVRKCLENDRTSSDKCRPNISIFVVGDLQDQIRDHVADAQASGSPSVVTKRAIPHKRNWITKLRRAGIVCQQPGQCDEYPMATHEEGGPNGMTSLRSVSASQNAAIGGMVGQFHRRCDVKIGEKYKFVAVTGVPLSGGICKK